MAETAADAVVPEISPVSPRRKRPAQNGSCGKIAEAINTSTRP